MELNKTKCQDCGNLNRWHSYKWASTPERQEHNRKNHRECPKCGSANVKNVEDDETMELYRHVAGVIQNILGGNDPFAGLMYDLPQPTISMGCLVEEPVCRTCSGECDGHDEEALYIEPMGTIDPETGDFRITGSTFVSK